MGTLAASMAQRRLSAVVAAGLDHDGCCRATLHSVAFWCTTLRGRARTKPIQEPATHKCGHLTSFGCSKACPRYRIGRSYFGTITGFRPWTSRAAAPINTARESTNATPPASCSRRRRRAAAPNEKRPQIVGFWTDPGWAYLHALPCYESRSHNKHLPLAGDEWWAREVRCVGNGLRLTSLKVRVEESEMAAKRQRHAYAIDATAPDASYGARREPCRLTSTARPRCEK
jgi:hypothetical protein